MASLGQLTAGIAHEIKNPLNFVNNFASLSVELLDELKETTAPALAALDEDKRADVDDTMELLTGNLEKIAEHGKRADNIVKSMLEHSRGVSGERREVDLNGVIEEALNLAYHGARAQDQSFNITLERDYAREPAAHRAGAAGDDPGVPQPVRQWLLRRHQAGAGERRRVLTARASPWRHAMPATRSRSGCATTASASRPRSGTSCSSRSSPPSRPARARGWASRSATTSSRNSMAARSRWRASPERSPSSPSGCHASSQLQHLGGGMSVSILVVDDEPDVALLFRQRFRREVREGTYVMHFASSGEMALEQLGTGVEPTLIVILSDINMPGMDGLAAPRSRQEAVPRPTGDDGDRLW